jgi:hypothetical protein
MQFKHKLLYIALGGVLVIFGLLGMTFSTSAQWTQKTVLKKKGETDEKIFCYTINIKSHQCY